MNQNQSQVTYKEKAARQVQKDNLDHKILINKAF